jgi:rhamnosyltransferase subunit B
MRPLYEFIAQQDPAETVVAAQSLALGARLAQEKLGIPLATLHLQPSLLRTVYDMPINGVAFPDWLPRPTKHLWWRLVDRFVIDSVLAEGVNAYRAELGLLPVTRLFHEWMHSPQRVLGLFPDWFAPPQPDWPPQIRLTGFPLFDVGEGAPLSPGLQRFLADGPAPLVFTFGSAMRHGQEHFAMAIEVARQLGQRAILLARERSQLPTPLPDTIHHESYVPLSDLLPHAALMVHHGGIGTLAQVLAAGIPQVVIALSHDQPDNARRVERLGVGIGLSATRLRRTALANAIHRLLSSPQVQARCRDLAGRLDGRQARETTANYIEELAAQPHPVAS